VDAPDVDAVENFKSMLTTEQAVICFLTSPF